MARYGMDYGRWSGGERYDRNQGFQGGERGFDEGYGGYGGSSGFGGGYGGMRSDGWGSDWRNFPGEKGWYGEGSPGYPSGSYDAGYGGAFRRGRFEGEGMGYDRGMRGGSFGGGYGGGEYGGGYGGREVGYGGFDYERGRGGGRWGGSRSEGRNQSRAAELMTENPECVTPDTSLTEVARKMRDLNVGIIPVVESMENRRLQGVITDRDITVRALAEGKDGSTTVRDCMTSHVESVNKNDPVSEVLSVMEREQVRRVPVTDREGRLVGIIAQADLVVDYAGDDPGREMRVEDTIQRISEPGNPRRSQMAAQGRGGSSPEQQGGMQASGNRSSRQTES